MSYLVLHITAELDNYLVALAKKKGFTEEETAEKILANYARNNRVRQ